MEQSPTYQLADLALGGKLREMVMEGRALKQSWQQIAQRIYDRTGGAVVVSDETLRRWFGVPAAEAS